MSFHQKDLDKSDIFGIGNISRVYIPYLIGNIRRNNPDMSSTVPYFPNLAGKTLLIEQGGDFSGTTLITFTNNSYAQALSDITTAGAGNFFGVDSNGYLSIKSAYSGNQNYIKLLNGTAQVIIGLGAYPSQSGVSYAGEIDTSKSNFYEKSTKGEVIALQNDPLNRETWNRGLAGVSYILDTVKANQDKEFAVPKEFDVSITGTSFTIASDERLYINAANILVSQPSTDQLANVIDVLDQYHNPVYDTNGDRVKVTSVTYGPLVNQTQSFSSWATADGKQVFGALAHFQKTKNTYTIQSAIGNTLTITGNAVADKVQPNDTLVISSATNLQPFSHNGEFLVDAVLSPTIIRVRAKGNTDFKLFALENPSCINTNIQIGEVLGLATVYVGKFLPLTMKANSMYFNLSASLPAGTYKVRLPIGRTLKELLQEDLTASDIITPHGGQVELGSKLLATLNDALKPRIIAKPSAVTSKTLFAEFFNNTTVGAVGTRVYSNEFGGLDVTYNGKWNGTSYVKDDAGQDTVRITENGTEIFLGNSTQNFRLAGTSTSTTMVDSFDVKDASTTVLSVPNFDGLSTGQIVAKQGINLGTGFTTDNQHLVEKVNYTCNTSAGKYTLLSETNLLGARKREYVKDDGTKIETFNAKWNGIAWIKDTSSVHAHKIVLGAYTLIYYTNNDSTVSMFTDTSWTFADELKNYFFVEDFVGRTDSITSTGKFTDKFFITTASNISVQSGIDVISSGSFVRGEALAEATGAAIALTTVAGSSDIGTQDFYIKLKLRITNRNALNTVAAGGFYMGNDDTNKELLIAAGNDSLNWFIRLGDGATTTDTNSGVAITSGSHQIIEFMKIYKTLNIKIDGISVYTNTNYTVNQSKFRPVISASGTGYSPGDDIVYIDYIKLWAAEYYN